MINRDEDGLTVFGRVSKRIDTFLEKHEWATEGAVLVVSAAGALALMPAVQAGSERVTQIPAVQKYVLQPIEEAVQREMDKYVYSPDPAPDEPQQQRVTEYDYLYMPW